ncbi:GNAT family N-acetyltransferase [Clostridium sp. MSJ-4]|uniref:GNAT family N-acetyltransferase n=1 Tax=Clostridium simiarum TaxID=2841506 RepID=A0ABS6EWB5_9CLOT|nr:GNAT family N-acetyltransferase [Clostridium simiarum]MBU5590366.1 GNAT family N-acetyltransferase [Clostridium simiarum]
MEVKRFKGEEKNLLEDAYKVRYAVFVEEQNVPVEHERDGLDEKSYHVVIYENNLPVATGRVVDLSGRYKIGRVCVLKEYRRCGYGEKVIEELIHILREINIGEVLLHAQIKSISFYERLGFKAYGNLFEEEGIEHIAMSLILRGAGRF